MSDSLLERARGGDQAAFAALTAPYRRELHVHCYRMLGSLTDADDLLQETMIAAWQGMEGFAGRSSVRAWLYRIATNRCLNAIRYTRRRPPTAPVPPFDPPAPSGRADVTWLQPYPDAMLTGPAARYESREAIALAFITALQRLPPRQTAAVLLRDVLDFPAADVARMLSIGPTALKGLLQRARATLDTRAPLADRPVRGSRAERDLANRFADAFASDDVERIVALLTDDGWLAMPPAPHEYSGREAVAAFLRASAAWRSGSHFDLRATRANNQPAFVCDLAGRPAGVIVLTLDGEGIRGITRFLEFDEPFRPGLGAR